MTKAVTGFNDLPVAELRRSAIEDFAVEVNETDNKNSVLAALTESGVTWNDYVAQHPEVAPAVDPKKAPANVVTAAAQDPDAPAAPVVEQRVITATAPVYNPGDVLLVKMERENPRFDIRGHSFTQAHPYALMSPEDATWLFSNEKGFRPAYPNELQEYYG